MGREEEGRQWGGETVCAGEPLLRVDASLPCVQACTLAAQQQRSCCRCRPQLLRPAQLHGLGATCHTHTHAHTPFSPPPRAAATEAQAGLVGVKLESRGTMNAYKAAHNLMGGM